MLIDYYRILSVGRDASLETIHSAYRALARQYHPDRNSGTAVTDLTRHMVLVNEAYACLQNPVSRQAYDHTQRSAEPLPLQIAVLSAADQLLERSGWQQVEMGFGDKVFSSGPRKVAVRFRPVVDGDQLDRWAQVAGSFFERKVADWAVVLAYRLLAIDAVSGTLSGRRRQITAIDLVDSRAFGDQFPDSEYKGLFQPFLIDS